LLAGPGDVAGGAGEELERVEGEDQPSGAGCVPAVHGLDDLGPALISITGHGDRLRMHCQLAYVNVRPAKNGAALTWEGAWEYDPVSGTGSVKLGKDGRLRAADSRV
jgi:hypothetical protein